MNSALPRHLALNCGIFTSKALVAWNALETRYGAQLSADELDLLFARFVLGLTTPFHGEDDPLTHLDVCRIVLALKLTPERIERALHFVPDPSDQWSPKALPSMEAIGLRDGHALREALNAETINTTTNSEMQP